MYPHYLQSYGNLQSYFSEHFERRNTNTEKGRTFVDFVKGLLPHTPIGSQFQEFTNSPKESHDGGVDIIGETNESLDILAIQSKYTIRGKEEFDSILSKFQNYEHDFGRDAAKNGTLNLFNEPTNRLDFVIITITNLNQIVKLYEDTRLGSKDFYNKLKNEGRIHIIDGTKIFDILKNVYRKLYILPSELSIKFSSDIINKDNVYIGILGTKELYEIYQNFGDALFFENIREFLGINKKQKVNQDILQTMKAAPDNFLSLNNGITFRTTNIKVISEREILLNEASIVNGCQTTMSVVNFHRENPNSNEGYVLVKIVQTTNSWDVAKSANFQNEINKIDLDLAQFISPQKVRLAADEAGYKMNYSIESPYALLDKIYLNRVSYESIRTLFTGFFSRNPINVLQLVHTEMKSDLLEGFFNDSNKNKVYQILFNISERAEKETEKINKMLSERKERELKTIFQRLLKSESARYQSLLTILACCAAYDNNVYESPQTFDYIKLRSFLEETEKVVLMENNTSFSKCYSAAFRVIANHIMTKHQESDKDKIAQSLYKDLQYANFNTLYLNMRLFLLD